MDEHVAMPADFAREAFAHANRDIFDEYINMRAQGHPTYYAFRIVFGEDYVGDNLTMARIYGIERNPYFKRMMALKIKQQKPDEIWTTKTAVFELLCLVRDKNTKETVRLTAIKELNILYGITIVDEKGNTRVGRTLDDFYKDAAGKTPLPGSEPSEPSEAPQTTH